MLSIQQHLEHYARQNPGGTRLPSSRDLCATFACSPVTVSKVVARLKAQGLVVTEVGHGSFVARQTSPEIADYNWQQLALCQRAVDPSSLANAMMLPQAAQHNFSSSYFVGALPAQEALRKAWNKMSAQAGLWEKAPTAGLPELRAILGQAIGADATEVIVTNGGQQAITVALKALGEPGVKVAVEAPTYAGALAAIRSAGMIPVPVPVDGQGMCADLLEQAIDLHGCTLAYLIPTLHNPTGAVMGTARRQAIIEVLERKRMFAIEDNWAHDFYEGQAPKSLFSMSPHGHVVSTYSLTKVVGSGLRIAAVAARGPALARLTSVFAMDAMEVARPMQVLAATFLGTNAFAAHVKALRLELGRRRDVLIRELQREVPQLHLAGVGQGGFYVWMRAADGIDPEQLRYAAAVEGVSMVFGGAFFAAEPPGQFLRLSCAGVGVEEIQDGVLALAKAFRCLEGR